MSLPGEPPAHPSAPKSKRAWLSASVVLVVVVLAVVGVVAWRVISDRSRSSAGTTASAAITGETVRQVLLDGAELTEMLSQPFTSEAGSTTYGGLHEMRDPSTPGDCTGVVNLAPRSVYRSADVQSYARETWHGVQPGAAGLTPPDAKVMFVEEAVIALPSAADARALFTKFAEQWKLCDGRAMNQASVTPDADNPPSFPGSGMHIADVRVTDTVLAASIVLDANPKAPDTRAVGVQGNCLIGVLIAFTGAANATGSADPATSSADAVRAMMDKAGKLS